MKEKMRVLAAALAVFAGADSATAEGKKVATFNEPPATSDVCAPGQKNEQVTSRSVGGGTAPLEWSGRADMLTEEVLAKDPAQMGPLSHFEKPKDDKPDCETPTS